MSREERRRRTRRESVRPAIPAMVAVALVAIACSTGGPSAPPANGSPAAASGAASPAPTASVAVTASPVTGAAATARPPSQPPNASLGVDGGDAVTGQLGSFTWNGGGSDSPWLPGAPIAVGQGERFGVALDRAVAVTGWSARRVVGGTADGSGAVGLGDGTGPVSFPAPPAGTWSVQVVVRFAGDLGSATYYWLVAVR